ncbi:KAT8 regulatory NSL complex subunit 3-like Protein [Tribolium castaneum]|uniref:KAT8 regulatory NSL complex subunit 3-like Protein n=2 Tax=Tribolium castaneum TaxID=7070 RepID=A0A139WN58_TRICA|nr:KAT8 regulatory NSL complex subunit 3-like Protein [Tribolium castaneum]
MSERLILSKNQAQIDGILDGSQKLLQILTAESRPTSEFNEFITPLPNMVVGSDGRFAYTNHLFNPYEREHWWIPMDHCYARPWNWRPESTFLRPTKTLFMPKVPPGRKKAINPLAPIQECDDVIDVVTDSEEPTPIYDKAKAKHLMEECEKHAAMARVDEGNEDWEESVSRLNWNTTQNRLFNGVVNILNADHLARLAHSDSSNEAIARRVTIDKSVERMRRLMATVSWDPKYTQWLHQILIDHLSTSYLAAYLDILQTLRSKLPTFVDKMMGAANSSKLSILSYETLFPLLKRPWDPVASSLMQDKPKKLPGNPVIVVVPSTPISSKRMLKWINLLSNLATVITVPANYGGGLHKTTMMNCVDQMFVITRNKIQDIRLDYPGRSIVLAGFGFGATLALQIAQVEQVLCVISIGFSLLTADGKRGEVDDNLLELQCPILFVIGQCSNTSLQEDMEDLRERMRVETGLIVVGNADDNLRVSKKKKKAEGITQSIVDRCVADEIGEFISGVILSPYPPQLRQSPTNLTTEGLVSKKLKSERKRYNSNTSSIDSEPPSPTPRISRPGQNSSHLGRPPGSKSKAKMEAKWAAQGIPSSPSNSPPHLSNTPDTSSNDSILTDKLSLTNFDPSPVVKKLKTLKPTVVSPEKTTTNQHTSTSNQNTAKAMGLQNRLSGLLQGDVSTLIQPSMVKSNSSGIKENVKITGGLNPKFFSNNGKMVDMSKVSVINPKSNNANSLVLLPDGKIKSYAPSVKVPGGRYITSKRQLLGNKPPKTVKKVSYISQPMQTNLSPPTNLTTQDIMNLPIIFADDNQILDNTLTQPEMKPVPSSPNSKLSANTGSKFMLINNKPSNFIISPNPKPSVSQPAKATPKYTKIILSSKQTATSNVVKKITNLPSEISVRKVTPSETATISQSEELDLENEIAASTLYKRKVESTDAECLEIVSNKPEEEKLEGESVKRTAEEANIDNDESTPCKVSKVETA